MSNIPDDEAGAAQWLSQLYVEKDEILDTFHKTGKFAVGGDWFILTIQASDWLTILASDWLIF